LPVLPSRGQGRKMMHLRIIKLSILNKHKENQIQISGKVSFLNIIKARVIFFFKSVGYMDGYLRNPVYGRYLVKSGIRPDLIRFLKKAGLFDRISGASFIFLWVLCRCGQDNTCSYLVLTDAASPHCSASFPASGLSTKESCGGRQPSIWSSYHRGHT
jgi:hypothetical protein